jgi:3-dehydroquinate synthase
MQVRVAVPKNPYSVHVGAGILAQLGEVTCRALNDRAQRAFLVTDSGVSQGTADQAAQSLSDRNLHVTRVSVTPTERAKSLATLQSLLEALARSKHERTDPVIALGGGIIGDVAGFAAATYRRGVPVVQCPTTLLAMVDASVGGKTGINLDLGQEGLQKNMVGAFWQPGAVVADVDALRSLPARELRAGLAECLKHALIGRDLQDPDLLEWTQANLPKILALDAQTLAELVSRNVCAKAHIVRDDEREEDPKGGRMLLNLGHTFAHAIETLPGLSFENTQGPLLHGEAVALGLVAAATTSTSVGLAPEGLPGQVQAMVATAGLPTKVRGLPPDQDLLARMSHDKKTRAGALRLILPIGDGRACVESNVTPEAIKAGLSAIRA